ncbi:hypothetical protein [Mycolicibacterium moriokaense]|uniref:Uncharacterized protein n=1 Tax=Mycolicibacterium moriokaense TaxID=39691 RepID=A0A318H556_9MYCO|nr:hypothetical protein [Mycolicibacterium moriokaense]PXW97381.1 hypothetical protein C8E89_1482 [Mycolicibacterium moriokaense]
MNDTDVEDAALALVDALGPDFIQLAPPDEHHLDSVSIAECVAFAMLGAVGSGITAGVKDWTKDKTVSVLDAVAAHIGHRLSGALRKPFSTVQTPEMRDADEKETALNVSSAREATAGLDPATADAVIAVGSAAARAALEDMGVDSRVSQRVQDELGDQLVIIIRR